MINKLFWKWSPSGSFWSGKQRTQKQVKCPLFSAIKYLSNLCVSGILLVFWSPNSHYKYVHLQSKIWPLSISELIAKGMSFLGFIFNYKMTFQFQVITLCQIILLKTEYRYAYELLVHVEWCFFFLPNHKIHLIARPNACWIT